MRSPEEYDGDWLDESVDIWPFGNLLFTLLTGLLPYYDVQSYKSIKAIQQATKRGAPYIDPRYKTRSFIEGRIVEIMERCHRVKAAERVSIFEVVKHLKQTRVLHQQQQQQQPQNKSSVAETTARL